MERVGSDETVANYLVSSFCKIKVNFKIVVLLPKSDVSSCFIANGNELK
jgi:hypothetical protein